MTVATGLPVIIITGICAVKAILMVMVLAETVATIKFNLPQLNARMVLDDSLAEILFVMQIFSQYSTIQCNIEI